MQMTLEYWNSLANQFILICSLLSGFSIAIVANLIVSKENDLLTNRILKTATVAAGFFLVALFAMTKMSMMTTPGGYLKNVTEDDFLIPKSLGILAFVLGLFALTFLLSLSGWTKSKSTGKFTTVIGVITLLLILFCMIDISFS